MQIVTIESKTNDGNYDLYSAMPDENLTDVAQKLREALNYSSEYFSDGHGMIYVTLYDTDGIQLDHYVSKNVHEVLKNLWNVKP